VEFEWEKGHAARPGTFYFLFIQWKMLFIVSVAVCRRKWLLAAQIKSRAHDYTVAAKSVAALFYSIVLALFAPLRCFCNTKGIRN